MENLKDESCKSMAKYTAKHCPEGEPYISAKDLQKSFINLCEIELRCDTKALDFYTGHSDGSARHRHYTAKNIEFMRKEIAENVEERAKRRFKLGFEVKSV